MLGDLLLKQVFSNEYFGPNAFPFEKSPLNIPRLCIHYYSLRKPARHLCCTRRRASDAIITVFKLTSKEPSSIKTVLFFHVLLLCGKTCEDRQRWWRWSKVKLNKRTQLNGHRTSQRDVCYFIGSIRHSGTALECANNGNAFQIERSPAFCLLISVMIFPIFVFFHLAFQLRRGRN